MRELTQEEQATADRINAIGKVIGTVILLVILAVGIFYFANRSQACIDAGGTYKVFENRCVVSLHEIELDV